MHRCRQSRQSPVKPRTMFNYWKKRYQELWNEYKAQVESHAKQSSVYRREMRALVVALYNCENCIVVADELSLVLQFDGVTIKSTNMSVTLPVNKKVRATIIGLRKSDNASGPVTGGEMSSTDSTSVSVVPALDTDGVTVLPNQFDVTTLKDGGTATLSFSAKNANGDLLSSTDDWTVGATVVIADSLGISYGSPVDVTPGS